MSKKTLFIMLVLMSLGFTLVVGFGDVHGEQATERAQLIKRASEYANEPHWTEAELSNAVGRLATWTHQKRRELWAKRISEANALHNVGDAMLLLSVIRKEANFNERVWNGTKRGPNGEYGAMQIHPNSGWRQFMEIECFNEERPGLYALTPQCAFDIGVTMFSHMKKTCGGSYYRAVTSYKYGRCISERDSRKGKMSKAARNARRYYCGVVDPDICDERWPE